MLAPAPVRARHWLVACVAVVGVDVAVPSLRSCDRRHRCYRRCHCNPCQPGHRAIDAIRIVAVVSVVAIIVTIFAVVAVVAVVAAAAAAVAAVAAAAAAGVDFDSEFAGLGEGRRAVGRARGSAQA